VHTPQVRRLLSLTAAAALAVGALSVGPAFADGAGHGPGHGHDDGVRGRALLDARLVGSMPAPASPVVAGVKPGGAPWVNGPSRVRVRADGRIELTIRGLVIPPPVGTGVNPVASVVATLVCHAAVVGSTAPFALDATGNGRTKDVIAVHGRCADPTVLIQPAANAAVYIASSVDRPHHDDDAHGHH